MGYRARVHHGQGSKMTLPEVADRLRKAIAELIELDEKSGGAIDLSAAIETLERAIRELEAH
jgi:hypothetical protein